MSRKKRNIHRRGRWRVTNIKEIATWMSIFMYWADEDKDVSGKTSTTTMMTCTNGTVEFWYLNFILVFWFPEHRHFVPLLLLLLPPSLSSSSSHSWTIFLLQHQHQTKNNNNNNITIQVHFPVSCQPSDTTVIIDQSSFKPCCSRLLRRRCSCCCFTLFIQVVIWNIFSSHARHRETMHPLPKDSPQ